MTGSFARFRVAGGFVEDFDNITGLHRATSEHTRQLSELAEKAASLFEASGVVLLVCD